MKILIIEDNEFLAELFEIAFTAQGFEVNVEKSGLGGKNLALAWKPDLILLDVMMPNLDGLSVLKAVRNQLPKTKIVMCSNLGLEKFKDQALALGADMVIDKSQKSPTEIVGDIQEKFNK